MSRLARKSNLKYICRGTNGTKDQMKGYWEYKNIISYTYTDGIFLNKNDIKVHFHRHEWYLRREWFSLRWSSGFEQTNQQRTRSVR